jgi:apolipoprotein D and lipocalin family protein
MASIARRLIAIVIGGLGISALVGCAPKFRPLPLASQVDLSRYSGRWYVSANIPHFAENGNVGSHFDINVKPDGTLNGVYTAHPKVFGAPTKTLTMNGYVVPDTGNARWRDIRDAATAGYSPASQPVIDAGTYQSLLGRLKDEGYDITQFRRVRQTPEQIGNPGFQ